MRLYPTVRPGAAFQVNNPRLTLRATTFTKALVFSNDGKGLFTGSADGVIRAWDPENGQPLGSFKGHAGDYAEVRAASGKVLGRRFPILSPIMVVLFLLTTALLVWSIAEYGWSLTSPKAVRAYVGWAVFAVWFLVLLARLNWRARLLPSRAGKTGSAGASPSNSAVAAHYIQLRRNSQVLTAWVRPM